MDILAKDDTPYPPLLLWSYSLLLIKEQFNIRLYEFIRQMVTTKAMRNSFFYAITSYAEFQKYGIPDDGNLP